ncbi:MAG: hypothetical protein PHU44_11915 [Syntrophales bacterium]|nr:hypothetical protein [Syntrophales bacterium]MDD5641334.1 hypothetical protein [Syntrophales bacterium]
MKRQAQVIIGLVLALMLVTGAGAAQIAEKALLSNSSEFGNFQKAKEIKEKGKKSLSVWENYAEFIKKEPSRVKSLMLPRPGELKVAYDEIWVKEMDYNPTLVVRRENRGKPYLARLYWLKNKVQAYTAEKYCQTDPLTWEKLEKPGYKIIAVVSRQAMEPELAKLAAKEAAFNALTPAEHLREAYQALAAGNPREEDIQKRTYGRLEDARQHLEALRRQLEKYDAEAKKLLQEVQYREKDLKKYKEVMQKAAREEMIKKREEMAKELDRDFLSKGFDVKIQLEGSDKSTLKLECVLFSRPMVFALVDKSDFLQNLRKAGFDEVIFTNKNIKFTWEIDLNI